MRRVRVYEDFDFRLIGSESVKNMDTYFIRHTWAIAVGDKTRVRMWKDRRIFIHFPWDNNNWKHKRFDSKSTKPDDYSHSAKRALRAMNQLDDGFCASEIQNSEIQMQMETGRT
jgi:hypothetical protein